MLVKTRLRHIPGQDMLSAGFKCSFTSFGNERGSAQEVPAEPIERWVQGAQGRCVADISPEICRVTLGHFVYRSCVVPPPSLHAFANVVLGAVVLMLFDYGDVDTPSVNGRS